MQRDTCLRNAIKGIIYQKFTHYLLTTLLMEGDVKCLSPQNCFGVSGVNSVVAKSNTIGVTGYHYWNVKKHKMPPYTMFLA